MKKTITIVLMTFALTALMILPGHQVTAQGFRFESFDGGQHLVPVYPNFISATQLIATNDPIYPSPYPSAWFVVHGFGGLSTDRKYLEVSLVSDQPGNHRTMYFTKEAARQLEHDLRLILGSDVIP